MPRKFGIKDKNGLLVPHKHKDENDEYPEELTERPESIKNIETITIVTENPTWVCIGGRWYKIA